LLCPSKRPADSLALDGIAALDHLAQTRGIGEQNGIAGEIQPCFDDVPSCPGDRRYDRGLAARKGINERRLTHVGRAENRDGKPVAQDLAEAAIIEMAADLAAELAEAGHGPRADAARKILVGEIDLGLEMGEGADEAGAPILVEGSEATLHLAER